ncbi:UDP-3-O-(3-hydroxymyristoyl)glucosamine N-acyltransferase [Acetobacteraceae bacterium]|nr:UDP-3-O-(3-hydroxymyristoyl)glucosamine N-acyltransferase [Acetobacteraceae bacterium]
MAIDEIPGDPRFFERQGPFSVEELIEGLACHIGGKNVAGAQEKLFYGVAPLQSAGEKEIAFLDNRRYIPLIKKTSAGAVIVSPEFEEHLPDGAIAIVADQPYFIWAKIVTRFFAQSPKESSIHATAVISPEAKIGQNVSIGAFCTIGRKAVIGDGSVIASHVSIGNGVVLGKKCRIYSHVSLECALLGNGVAIHTGARIGHPGFGFAIGAEGFQNIPQIGRVVIGDYTEIGANTAVDRGSVRDTVIGAGCRIDNLVQIAHNVRIGNCVVIVSQAGISGSTEIGDFVQIAAQAGLTGHLKIGSRARIGAQCGVMSSVEEKADVIGSPALPFREFFRNVATLRRLSRRPAKGEKSKV